MDIRSPKSAEKSQRRIVSRKVLALKGSPRLERFRQCPGGEEFNLFEAWDGRAGQLDHLVNFRVFEKFHRRQPTGGEIGCALSHLAMYRDFAEQPGQPSDLLLVVEDDVVLPPGVNSVIDAAIRKADPFDVLVLGSGFGVPHKRRLKDAHRGLMQSSLLRTRLGRFNGVGPYWIARPEGLLCGAFCYVISRRGASVLVDAFDRDGRLHWIADEWKYFRNEYGLRVLFMTPNLVDFEGESTISGRPAKYNPPSPEDRARPWSVSELKEGARHGYLTLKSTAKDVRDRIRRRRGAAPNR